MKKVLLILLAIAIVGAGSYFVYSTFVVSETQQDLSENVDDVAVQTCQSTKESTCALDNTVSEEDYSENCFENGEHILEDPYTCSS